MPMDLASFRKWIEQIYATQDREPDCDTFMQLVPQYVDLQEQVRQVSSQLDALGSVELERRKLMDYLQEQLLACCDASDEALRDRKCKQLHAWRKDVKRILYQLQVLSSPNTRRMKLAKRLDKLGKHLGLVHDYCFIQEMIANLGDEHVLKNDAAPLVKLLDKKRDKQIKKCAKLQHAVCRTGLLRIE